MNFEEAKKICPDFLPERQADGKLRCRYKIGEEMCKHDKHFVCDLVLHVRSKSAIVPAAKPPEPPKPDDPSWVSGDQPRQTELPVVLESRPRVRIAVIISASRTNTIEKCPRLYDLNYNLKVQPPYEAAWKRVGTAFSECRAKIDHDEPWNLSNFRLTDVEEAKLHAILTAYEKSVRNKEEKLVTETQVKFELDGQPFVGYIDAETTNGEHIYEWKYAAEEYDNLRIARQAAVYYYGRPQARNFTVALAKKPQHKPKKAPKPTKKEPNPKDETIEEFKIRLSAEIGDNIKDWFRFRSISRKEIDPELVLRQMIRSMSLLPEIEKAAFPPHYSGDCDNCEFQVLCESHLTREIGCTHSMCKTRSMCTQIIAARERLQRR
jgi:hypothetical protein